MRRWSNRARVPRVPKPAKLRPPKGHDLRIIYKQFVNADITQRLATLAYALQWWDGAIDYAMKTLNPLPLDAAKAIETAHKARQKGGGTHSREEQETAFMLAIKQYEKVAQAAQVQYPPLATYRALYEQKKPVLENKQNRLALKFGSITELLMKAIKPVNQEGATVKLAVGDTVEPRKFDPQLSQMTYNRQTIRQMQIKLRREGLLPLVLQEVKWLSRALALEPHPTQTGAWVANAKKWVDGTFKLMENFSEFAVTSEAPRRLVRQSPSQVAARVKQPRDPNAPHSGAGLKRGNERIGAGAFIKGTAIANVFETLKDQKEHDVMDLQKMVPAQIEGRLRVISIRGKDNGHWNLHINSGKAKLEIIKPLPEDLQQAVHP